MNDIISYIIQARHAGINDNDIRQNLIMSGWKIEDIDESFHQTTNASYYVSQDPNTIQPSEGVINYPEQSNFQLPPVQSNNADSKSGIGSFKRPNKKVFFALILVVIIVVAASLVFAHGPKSSYNKTAQSFISAIQDKNKTLADSLESTEGQAYFKTGTDDPSFYDTCQQSGAFCTNFFKASNISKAKKTVHSYKSNAGVEGKEVTYTEQGSLNSSSLKCSDNSSTELNLALVPNASSWQIDYVNVSINAGSDNCGSS
jgi:hypothetical protein